MNYLATALQQLCSSVTLSRGGIQAGKKRRHDDVNASESNMSTATASRSSDGPQLEFTELRRHTRSHLPSRGDAEEESYLLEMQSSMPFSNSSFDFRPSKLRESLADAQPKQLFDVISGRDGVRSGDIDTAPSRGQRYDQRATPFRGEASNKGHRVHQDGALAQQPTAVKAKPYGASGEPIPLTHGSKLRDANNGPHYGRQASHEQTAVTGCLPPGSGPNHTGFPRKGLSASLLTKHQMSSRALDVRDVSRPPALPLSSPSKSLSGLAKSSAQRPSRCCAPHSILQPSPAVPVVATTARAATQPPVQLISAAEFLTAASTTPELVSALSALMYEDLLPMPDDLVATLGYMYMLCRRASEGAQLRATSAGPGSTHHTVSGAGAGRGAESHRLLSPEGLLATLWLVESVSSQYRCTLSDVLLQYVDYTDAGPMFGVPQHSPSWWRTRLPACQLELLQLCGWRATATATELNNAVRDLLMAEANFPSPAYGRVDCTKAANTMMDCSCSLAGASPPSSSSHRLETSDWVTMRGGSGRPRFAAVLRELGCNGTQSAMSETVTGAGCNGAKGPCRTGGGRQATPSARAPSRSSPPQCELLITSMAERVAEDVARRAAQLLDITE